MIARPTGGPALEPDELERLWDLFDDRLFELGDELHKHGLRRGVAMERDVARQLAVDVLCWMRRRLDAALDEADDEGARGRAF